MALPSSAIPNLTNLEQGPVVIRPLRSMTPAQAELVAQAVAALPTPWRVECHDDYDGYLSVIVSSAEPDAPTFAISGTASKMSLSEMRDDVLYPQGHFSTVEEAVDALINLQGRSG